MIFRKRRKNMKYSEWLKEWDEVYLRPGVKEHTAERYAQLVRQHLIPALGDVEITEITPPVLQRVVSDLMQKGNKRTGSGLSASTVNSVINVMRVSLRAAMEFGIIETNAAEKIHRPKNCEKAVTCFSVAEQNAITEAVLHGKKKKLFGVVLCLYSGLRIGELLALEWDDVDLRACTLSVSKACHDGKAEDGKYGRIVDTPKSASSIRLIPLPHQLVPLLREQKRSADSNYVVSSGGKPISVRSYQKSFEVLLRRLKIAKKGFHALRHTFATRAIECGMDVKTLSEILGHKSPLVTLNRYAHSLWDHKKDMMNRLGKSLPAPAQKTKKAGKNRLRIGSSDVINYRN